MSRVSNMFFPTRLRNMHFSHLKAEQASLCRPLFSIFLFSHDYPPFLFLFPLIILYSFSCQTSNIATSASSKQTTIQIHFHISNISPKNLSLITLPSHSHHPPITYNHNLSINPHGITHLLLPRLRHRNLFRIHRRSPPTAPHRRRRRRYSRRRHPTRSPRNYI